MRWIACYQVVQRTLYAIFLIVGTLSTSLSTRVSMYSQVKCLGDSLLLVLAPMWAAISFAPHVSTILFVTLALSAAIVGWGLVLVSHHLKKRDDEKRDYAIVQAYDRTLIM